MSSFTIEGGIATIHDPALYDTWLDDEEFKAAVAEADTPERTAIKRLLVEFEADLARFVRDGTVQENIADFAEQYVAEHYVQHDPNAAGNGRGALIEHLSRIPLGGPTAPPVVGVILEGELACVQMQQLLPDPTAPGQTYVWTILTTFRVVDGKLSEHWSTFRKTGQA